MSRIGNKPIPVPKGIKVAVNGRTVSVEGPKGKLSWAHRLEIAVKVDGGMVVVSRSDDSRTAKSLHGTTRTLIANMIEGCLNGYERKLEVFGVGYGVQLQANKLSLTVGFAYPRVFDVPPGVIVTVQTPQAKGDAEPARLTISGPDKQAVGEFAADVRLARPPEPYKGKGVRYVGEYVRRKVGKAFAGAAGA